MQVDCQHIEIFDKVYHRWSIQRALEAGTIYRKLGNDVEHVNVLGRKYRDPYPESDLGYGISLVEEPENPKDPKAIAVHREGVCIGYVPRNRTASVRTWMHFVKEDKAICVNSLTAIYLFHSQNFLNSI